MLPPAAWTSSCTESPDNPSAMSAAGAIARAIGAASACADRARAPRSAPLAGFDWRLHLALATFFALQGVGLCAELVIEL